MQEAEQQDAQTMQGDYAQAWMAMTRLMEQGYSWSGRERNCCYLNLGDGTFANVSAVSGLDWPDDGRAVAVTDWDGDGRQDLWFKNRTSPSLRFVHNESLPGHWVAFRLEGVQCNRDAIGAEVVVKTGGRSMLQTLLAGDGYLSQSSKWIHFGLGADAELADVTVRWPGGEVQPLGLLAVDQRYRVRQGEKPEEIAARPAVTLPTATATTQPAATIDRVVLRTPLPLPPSFLKDCFAGEDQTEVRLLNLWASWCAPCVGELTALAESYDDLHAAGLRVIAVNLDEEAKRAEASKLFADRIVPRMKVQKFGSLPARRTVGDTLDLILRHVLGRMDGWSLPTSLLIDRQGRMQVIYLGPVSVAQVEKDLRQFGLAEEPEHRRAALAGRWFYQVPRHYGQLVRELAEIGLTEAADFYRELQLNLDIR